MKEQESVAPSRFQEARELWASLVICSVSQNRIFLEFKMELKKVTKNIKGLSDVRRPREKLPEFNQWSNLLFTVAAKVLGGPSPSFNHGDGK